MVVVLIVILTFFMFSIFGKISSNSKMKESNDDSWVQVMLVSWVIEAHRGNLLMFVPW